MKRCNQAILLPDTKDIFEGAKLLEDSKYDNPAIIYLQSKIDDNAWLQELKASAGSEPEESKRISTQIEHFKSLGNIHISKEEKLIGAQWFSSGIPFSLSQSFTIQELQNTKLPILTKFSQPIKMSISYQDEFIKKVASLCDAHTKKVFIYLITALFGNTIQYDHSAKTAIAGLLNDQDSEVSNHSIVEFPQLFLDSDSLIKPHFNRFLEYLMTTRMNLGDFLEGFVLEDQELILKLTKQTFLIYENYAALKAIDQNHTVVIEDKGDIAEINQRLDLRDQIYSIALFDSPIEFENKYINDPYTFYFVWNEAKVDWYFSGRLCGQSKSLEGYLNEEKGLKSLSVIFNKNNDGMRRYLGDAHNFISLLDIIKPILGYCDQPTVSHHDLFSHLFSNQTSAEEKNNGVNEISLKKYSNAFQ